MVEHARSLDSDSGSRSWWRVNILATDRRRRRRLIALTLNLVLLVGLADFFSGFELSFQTFYILPICLAVAAVGWRFGIATALLSIASALLGDFASGAKYVHASVAVANVVLAFGTYLAVIALFSMVVALQREMEERVRQRTTALQSVIAERERLEKAIMEISERERHSIGRDLHDGLGQHLTGTAFAAQVLEEKLQARELAEEESDARKIVDLIEEAIEKSRRLAKGLLLAEIHPDSFVTSLQDLAADVSAEFRTTCEFRSRGEVRLTNTVTATHLFHIAHEAVRNAIRHGGARTITVTWELAAGCPQLTVADNGSGLPPSSGRGKGLGLSIMAHRAEIIGWTFAIRNQADGGTLVTCTASSPVASPDHV